MTRLAVVALGLVLSIHAAPKAQSLADIAKAEAERRGEALPSGKVLTNADLPPAAPVATPTVTLEVARARTPQWQDALASLRAVQSALSGGANRAEFKKYYLDARIKVDALPDSPANAPLLNVSNLYRDASALTVAYLTRSMSAADLHDFKARYAGDPQMWRFLREINDAGLGLNLPAYEREREAVYIDGAAQVLMFQASEKLKTLP